MIHWLHFKSDIWLYGCCIALDFIIASDLAVLSISDNLNNVQITLCTESFHLYQHKDHRHQESVYESQQWWQSTKWFMLQCMLGTSIQDSPMYPSMHCSMNKQCSWIVWLFSFILTILFYVCCFSCDFLVACFVMFRVLSLLFCWLSPLLRFICWFLMSVVFGLQQMTTFCAQSDLYII